MKRVTLALFACFSIFNLWSQVDSLYRHLEITSNDSQKNEVYKQLFDYYYNTENDSAGIIANLQHAFAKEHGSPTYTIESLINLGLYQDVLVGNMDQSLKYYREAYDIAESHRLPILKDIAFYIGVTFHVIDDYKKAKQYYSDAYHLSEKFKDEYRFLASGINLASVHSSMQSYDTAELLFKEILLKSRNNLEYGSLHDKARMNLANLYVRKQQFSEAYSLIESSFHYQIQNSLFRDALQSLNYLVEAKIGNNHLTGMDSLIWLNKTLINSTKNARILSLGYRNLAEAYAAVGNYEQAFLTKKLHMDTYEKYKASQREDLIYEMESKYLNEKQQNEINTLKVASQQATIASQRRVNQRNLFIFLSSIFLLLIVFFVIRNVQKNKSNALLAEKNKVIASALEEKEILLKEVHHRVKNNLQVISSLLNLQADSLSDESALQAIMDGQNRVKSMSLIHQRLYQENDLRGVDVYDYLKNLIPQLINSFTLEDKEIDYRIDVGNMKLDVDTLVPLGLIINELVTNSMKHAFAEVETGVIELKMTEENGQLHVRIKDNGKGLDESRLEKTNSFGWKMIGSLCRKLKAELSILNEGGTVVDILIGRYKLVV